MARSQGVDAPVRGAGGLGMRGAACGQGRRARCDLMARRG
jgi:hypothetical protein